MGPSSVREASTAASSRSKPRVYWNLSIVCIENLTAMVGQFFRPACSRQTERALRGSKFRQETTR